MQNSAKHRRTYRVYNWIGSHVRVVAVAALLVAIGLGVIGPMVANTEEPNFDPDGEIFTAFEDADATLQGDSTIRTATWLIESTAEGGNVLDRNTLTEWFAASEAVRNDPEHSKVVVARYDADTGITTLGLSSIADIVDSFTPSGIESASDNEVRAAVTRSSHRTRRLQTSATRCPNRPNPPLRDGPLRRSRPRSCTTRLGSTATKPKNRGSERFRRICVPTPSTQIRSASRSTETPRSAKLPSSLPRSSS